MRHPKSMPNLKGRTAPGQENSKPQSLGRNRRLVLVVVLVMVLATALPQVWSFETVQWDTLEFFGSVFSLTTAYLTTPTMMRPGEEPRTLPIFDHRYQSLVLGPSMGTGNVVYDTVSDSDTIHNPGIDSSTFTNRGAVLPAHPLACCLPPRGFGDANGTLYFPFSDQLDSHLKLGAIPWGGGPAAVTTIDDVLSSISTLFGVYSSGYTVMTFDFSDLAHIYVAPFGNPTAYSETGTIPSANPALTGYHQELAGDLTWGHSCYLNVPPFSDPAQAEARLHNLFTGTAVDQGSVQVTPVDLTAGTGFTRNAVATTPFVVSDVIQPVCVGGAGDPGDDTFTVFAAVTQNVGPPSSMRTIDLPGLAAGTPVVGAVDNIVWGVTPSPDGSRCFMCNFGELEDDPFCTVMSGAPFIYHVNRLDDNGQSGNTPSLGRIPLTFTQDSKLRPSRIGGENGFILHPLDSAPAEPGPAPPGTTVVYGAIDVPFFFHNFESGDFRFWSSVQGQAGG